nr:putative ribonuclease H-like domain-containing protein [Tanacetum cinerariifolium]
MDQGLAQIENDAELAQRIYEEELAELDRVQKERQKQEEATIANLTEEFDEIQARMDADHKLDSSYIDDGWYFELLQHVSREKASSNLSSHIDSKPQKDYKTEYKKMKAKLALLEARYSSPHNPKTFQPKNNGLVAKIFSWDEEEVFEDEEVTQVKVLMALVDDELTVGKSHARNGEWVDITIRKGASPSSEIMPLTFQPHSPKERPGLGIMKHTKPETQESSNKSVSRTVTISETKQIKPLVPTEVKYTEQESKLNELTKLVQMLIDEKVNPNQMTQESSRIQKTELSRSVDSSRMSQDSKIKFRTLAHQSHSGPSLFKSHNLSVNSITIPIIQLMIAIEFYCMICKKEDQKTSDHEMYIASLKRSKNFKAQPYQYASSSKQILKVKAKPFPSCTHYGFNDHRPDDCRNYPECKIYKSYDHSTLGYNYVIHIRGGVLAESSQSNEPSVGVKCNTCGSTVHYTSDHNEFDYFKRGEKIQAAKAREPTKKWWMLKEYDWCQELSAQICRASRKKSQAPGMIMSFVRMVENQNDVKVKQIRTDNETKFRNHELENFCDEKGISQNFSSPYTPKQNGVAEKKNKTLMKAARTMLNGSILWSTIVGDLEDKGVESIVTSSPSSGMISKHFLRYSDSLSSSTFCFLDLSYSISSPALFELPSCVISALAFFEISFNNLVM